MRLRIHRDLLNWYDAEKRDMPWRRTNDPYAIWVSEIMLQQTQVATVIPYFERWMKRFPTAQTLAAADIQDVLSIWQGLGYYRRCRLLHQGAQFIADTRLPETNAEWMAVPGVGRYTAGAIASIAFQQTVPLIDGNVERVYARLTGNRSTGRALNAEAWRWAEKALCKERPGDWNQALMELGACVCKPVAPLCEKCPVSRNCFARKQNLQTELPIKQPKPTQVRRCEIVWMPYHQGKFGVSQIPDGEWWHGMWEFPRATDQEQLRKKLGIGKVEHAGKFIYHVTHHRIRLDAFLLHTPAKADSLKWMSEEELGVLPMPSPQRKALKFALARLSAPILLPEEAGKVTLV